MRVVVQRVLKATITIDHDKTKTIGPGLFLLVGVAQGDDPAQAEALAKKCAELRIFEDEAGKMNLSAESLGLDALVVSNFTLYADTHHGRRPSFINAGKPPFAQEVYERFLAATRAQGYGRVECGEFGAYMEIDPACDGPVTIILDPEEWARQ